MLSIRPVKGSGSGYVDYVLKEASGRWLGEGVPKLGLESPAKPEHAKLIAAGFAPPDDRKLGQWAGNPKRLAMQDLTFSSAFDTSLVRSVAAPLLRDEMGAVHDRAVEFSVEVIQKYFAFSRRGKGGCRAERVAGLLALASRHEKNRDDFQQQHTHVCLMNVAFRRDDTCGSVYFRPIYRAKLFLGSVFRLEEARGLTELGFEVQPADAGYRIVGVPEHFRRDSTRRVQIVAKLKEWGRTDAVAAAKAAVGTRRFKAHAATEDLFEGWKQRGHKRGFTSTDVERIRSAKPISHKRALRRLERIIADAPGALTTWKDSFERLEFLTHICHEAVGLGLTARAVLRKADADLREPNANVIALGKDKEQKRWYTTRQAITQREALFDSAKKLNVDFNHVVDERALNASVERVEQRLGISFSDNDIRALRHLTQGSGAIALAAATNTATKLQLLEAAREVWRLAGFRVVGAASNPGGVGALERIGIESEALGRRLHDLDTPMRATLPDLKPFMRASHAIRYAERITASRRSELFRMDARTVLVIDNPVTTAGDLTRLFKEAGRTGAKIVLLKDETKSGLEDRTPLGRLCQALGRATVGARGSKGQVSEAARDSIRELEARGLLTRAPSPDFAIANLIVEWRRFGGLEHPRDNVITAASLEAVRELNLIAQRERELAWQLHPVAVRANGYDFLVGDRVVFERSNRRLAVRAGETGTVVAVNVLAGAVTVAHDVRRDDAIVSENLVTFRVRGRGGYAHLALGYAVKHGALRSEEPLRTFAYFEESQMPVSDEGLLKNAHLYVVDRTLAPEATREPDRERKTDVSEINPKRSHDRRHL